MLGSLPAASECRATVLGSPPATSERQATVLDSSPATSERRVTVLGSPPATSERRVTVLGSPPAAHGDVTSTADAASWRPCVPAGRPRRSRCSRCRCWPVVV